MKFYAIDEADLARLKRLATRLYTETRMNGDEMRDAGHTITSVVRAVETLGEIPEEKNT